MIKALVVIDVQNYYINDETRKIPNKIAKYIDESDCNFVLFTKFVNTKDSSLSKFLHWDKMQASPDTDICENLNRFIKPDNVFEKNTYSIFKSEQFIKFLEDNKVDEILLCGLDTDACILASQYDGFDRGFKITVLNELCSSHSGKEFHNSALNIIEKNLQ